MRVLPTARAWVLTVTCLLWLQFGLRLQAVWAVVVAGGGLLLVGSSLVAGFFCLKGIRVTRPPCGDGTAGEELDLPLAVVNCGQRTRPAFLVLEESEALVPPSVATLVPALSPGGQPWLIQRRVLPLRRGVFELADVRLRSTDAVGLFRWERRVRAPGRFYVLPRSDPLPASALHTPRLLPTPTANPFSSTGAGMEVYGVREYVPSDGAQSVHWKSSARVGRLMVREFEREARSEVAVAVDALEPRVSGPQPWSNLEFTVRLAAGICRHVARSEGRLSFLLGGAGRVVVPLQDARCCEDSVLRHLAALQPGSVTLEQTIGPWARTLPPGTTVVCLSLDTGGALRRQLAECLRRGLRVVWFNAGRAAFASQARVLGAVPSGAVGNGALTAVELTPESVVAEVFEHVG